MEAPNVSKKIVHGRRFQNDIDLLTDDETVKSAGNKIRIVFFFIPIILLELVVFAVVWFLSANSTKQLTDLSTKIQSDSAAQGNLNSVASDLKTIKGKLLTYGQDTAKYQGTDSRIKKISSLLPNGVSLLRFTLNSQGKVLLDGTAQTSDLAYQFYYVLGSDKTVSSLSLSTLSKVANTYHFTISFIMGKTS